MIVNQFREDIDMLLGFFSSLKLGLSEFLMDLFSGTTQPHHCAPYVCIIIHSPDSTMC